MGFSDIPACLSGCTLAQEYTTTWVSLVGAIILTVASILALAFMISRASNRRDWEATVRLETYHLAVAVIWVTLILSVSNLTCSLSCSITKDEDPFTSSINYVGQLSNKIASFSQSLYDRAKNMRIYSAEMEDYEVVYYAPLAGCNEIANAYENYAALLTPFIASLLIQQYALILISKVAFQFILPIGIVLRLIPGMKDTAAYLIGIAFAFYIIFPLTYVAAEKMTESFVFQPNISTSSDSDCLQVSEIDSIMQTIGSILPQAIFFPALSSIITIAAARALSEIFKYDFAEIMER